jgi:hypothetical protein
MFHWLAEPPAQYFFRHIHKLLLLISLSVISKLGLCAPPSPLPFADLPLTGSAPARTTTPASAPPITPNVVAHTSIKTAPNTIIGITQTASLLKTAKPSLMDATGWASELLDALKQNDIAQSKENVCSVIATLAQESGFVANPSIPNLGKLSEKAVINKLNQIPVLGGQAEAFLYRYPTTNNSFMQRIHRAKTERDLDLAYRDLINGLAQEYKLDFMLNNGFGRDLIEGNNEIDTIGSMQVSVKFATEQAAEMRGKPLALAEVYQLRDKLYTRKGGLYYGIMQLLAYDTGYNKKLFRFADFNAGRYASRNAAFQTAISILAGQPLATDGDLLMYDKEGQIVTTVSNSEAALQLIAQKYALKISDEQIRRDLILEKTLTFNTTSTYKTITGLYRKVKKVDPAYAVVPNITLHSPKTSQVLTTAKYANSVNGRYQRCIGLP